MVVDGGIDDALALGVVLGLGMPVAQVVATEGSVDLTTTAHQTARLMATLGSEAPVRLGEDTGLCSPYPGGRDPFHGTDCFGGQGHRLRPADVPSERWTPMAGPVLATGALTAVAQSIQAGHALTSVTWMGGSVARGGNMTPAAEFNAWMDPEAADAVLCSAVPTTMIPLDVTLECAWGRHEIDLLSRSASGSLFAHAAEATLARDGVFIPHDAVAAVALAEPSLFKWRPLHLRCDTGRSDTRGATFIDPHAGGDAGSTIVAEEIDAAAVTQLILDAIRSL